MSGLSRQGIADRAGVDRAFVDHLVELGILLADHDDRFGEGGVRRVRMVKILEGAGISLEGLAAMIASGDLPLDLVEVATAERFASYSEETFQRLSDRTGLPTELLMVIREATGSAQPGPQDRVREDELRVVPLIEFQLGLGLRPIVIERALRVYGESLRRMTETEAGWWQTDIVAPRLAAGQGWSDIGALAGEQSPELSRRSEEAILAIYHAHQSAAWMKNILEGIESALSAAGLQDRPRRSSPAVCFLDLTGYTRLTEEHGDEAAASLADQLARMVQRTSSQHGGKPVKWLGDGVMFHFPDPARGVIAALDMVEAATATGLPPAHVGLHAGPVLFQDGDYFGRTVNVAARIADYARPGEVVVSQAVVDLADGPGVRYTEIGAVELKGVSGTQRLHVAIRGT
jgi:class 3 adenylate cyclase